MKQIHFCWSPFSKLLLLSGLMIDVVDSEYTFPPYCTQHIKSFVLLIWKTVIQKKKCNWNHRSWITHDMLLVGIAKHRHKCRNDILWFYYSLEKFFKWYHFTSILQSIVRNSGQTRPVLRMNSTLYWDVPHRHDILYDQKNFWLKKYNILSQEVCIVWCSSVPHLENIWFSVQDSLI